MTRACHLKLLREFISVIANVKSEYISLIISLNLYNICLWNIAEEGLPYYFSSGTFCPIWLSYALFRNEHKTSKLPFIPHLCLLTFCGDRLLFGQYCHKNMFSSDICFSNKRTDVLSVGTSRASTSNRYVFRTLNIRPMKLSSTLQYKLCLYSKRAAQ